MIYINDLFLAQFGQMFLNLYAFLIHTMYPNTSIEETLVTAKVPNLLKKGIKQVTKKQKVKQEPKNYCPMCNHVTTKEDMKRCTECQNLGYAIYDFCPRCILRHTMVGSPYTHKAQWKKTYPDSVIQV